jgi:hypothetical protein
MGSMIGDLNPGRGWEFFSSLPRADRLWAHPASYPMGTRGSFPGGKAAGVAKLTTHLHLVPKLRMHRAIPPLPQYASMEWCLVKKKHRDNFTFYATGLMTDNYPTFSAKHSSTLQCTRHGRHITTHGLCLLVSTRYAGPLSYAATSKLTRPISGNIHGLTFNDATVVPTSKVRTINGTKHHDCVEIQPMNEQQNSEKGTSEPRSKESLVISECSCALLLKTFLMPWLPTNVLLPLSMYASVQ